MIHALAGAMHESDSAHDGHVVLEQLYRAVCSFMREAPALLLLYIVLSGSKYVNQYLVIIKDKQEANCYNLSS